MHANPVLLSCQGWRLGSCYVPPFAVRAGELIRIQFPNRADVPRGEFRQTLCAMGDRGTIQSTGIVIADDRPFPRAGWRHVFRRQRIGEWFSQRTGLSVAECRSFLERVDLDPTTPLSDLPGNPLKLL